MRLIDGIYLISATPATSQDREKMGRVYAELKELAGKYSLDIRVMSAPHLLREGETYYCSKCDEQMIIGETRSSLPPVPPCPFCGNTDYVKNLFDHATT